LLSGFLAPQLLVSKKLIALCQGDHPALVATPRCALYVVRNKRRVLTLSRVCEVEM
jgi:hypothetical protein